VWGRNASPCSSTVWTTFASSGRTTCAFCGSFEWSIVPAQCQALATGQRDVRFASRLRLLSGRTLLLVFGPAPFPDAPDRAGQPTPGKKQTDGYPVQQFAILPRRDQTEFPGGDFSSSPGQ